MRFFLCFEEIIVQLRSATVVCPTAFVALQLQSNAATKQVNK